MRQSRLLVVDDNTAIHEDIRKVLVSPQSTIRQELETIGRDLFATPEQPKTDSGIVIEYDIDDAFQGEQAIEMVEAAEREGRPYSLVFMDVRMPPGMDGIKTSREIWERFPNTEIAIITAYSDYSWEQILLELGSTDRLLFIRKPFDAVAIKQTALAMCTKWDLDNQNRVLIRDLEKRVEERTMDLKVLLKEKEGYIRTIQEELDFAESVQRRLLPGNLPQFEIVNVAARYIPTGKVGGDFYDVMQLDDNTIAFLIFDVSGHGLAAALVTAIGKATFTQHLKTLRSPAEIFYLVNKEVHACTPDGMFITAFLIVFDIPSRLLKYCNAGHVPPQYFNAKQGTVEDLRGGGPFLGIIEGTRYEEKTLQIEMGDKILLYTDGLTEASNPDLKLYGRQRLRNFMLNHLDLDCNCLLDKILEENDAYLDGAPRADDLCLLALHFEESEFCSFLRQQLPEEDKMVASFQFRHLSAEPEIGGINTAVLSELNKFGYSDKIIKQMRVVLIEILMNAIYHGNNGEQDKITRVAYHVNADRVIVGIMDQGKGFDPDTLPLPTDPQNVEKTSGRGIFIARHLVDSLEYVGEGNCVILITYRRKGEQG